MSLATPVQGPRRGADASVGQSADTPLRDDVPRVELIASRPATMRPGRTHTRPTRRPWPRRRPARTTAHRTTRAALRRPRARRSPPTRPTWTILIPAYNEQDALPIMVERLRRVVDERYEILLVNDGSTDDTARVARACGLRVLEHDVNQGKAAALRTGVAAARGRDVILIDADDTYPVECIADVAARLESYEYVVGVRAHGREHISLFNRLGNDAFRYIISWVAGGRLSDPLSGLYGVRRVALEHMDLRSRGFAIEAEIAIKACRGGLRYAELPIDYGPRIGSSKLHPIRDGVLILREALAHWRWTSPVQASVTVPAGTSGGAPRGE